MLFYLSLFLLISKKTCDFLFPEKMKKIYMNITLCSLNAYAISHMFIQKYYNKFYLYINKHIQNDFFLFIKDGFEIKTSQLDFLKCKENYEYYDMVLYTNFIRSDDTLTKNILRLSNLNDINHLKISNIISSNVKFMGILVVYNGNDYRIEFDKEDNYYIVGNKLFDKAFIKWYLNKYHGVLIDDGITYTCNILDYDVNLIQIDSSSHIIINKDNYTVEKVKMCEETIL